MGPGLGRMAYITFHTASGTGPGLAAYSHCTRMGPGLEQAMGMGQCETMGPGSCLGPI